MQPGRRVWAACEGGLPNHQGQLESSCHWKCSSTVCTPRRQPHKSKAPSGSLDLSPSGGLDDAFVVWFPACEVSWELTLCLSLEGSRSPSGVTGSAQGSSSWGGEFELTQPWATLPRPNLHRPEPWGGESAQLSPAGHCSARQRHHNAYLSSMLYLEALDLQSGQRGSFPTPTQCISTVDQLLFFFFFLNHVFLMK